MRREIINESGSVWGRKLECVRVLEGHGGCCNSVRWSENGDWLVSGSDDRTVGLWSMNDLSTPLVRARTVHRHNIFDACICPNQDGCIVSCGADGRVGFVDAGRPGGPGPAQLLFGTGRHQETIASKMSFLSPECFLVAFYDGKVRALDARQPPSQHPGCIALDLNGNASCALEVRPSQPHLFALGTDDSALRICDLRRADSSSEKAALSCFRKPHHDAGIVHSETLTSPSQQQQEPEYIDDYAEEASSSSSFPLCTDDDDDIHIDETNTEPINHIEWSPADWLTGYSPKASVRSAHPLPLDNNHDVGISGVSWCPNDTTKLAANFRGDDVYVFSVSRCGQRLSSSLRFSGRDNVATCAKEVRWLFHGSCLATGGDDGGLYLWRASDASPLLKVRADRNVVNSLAPHPILPLLATSGVDSEIKLFEATAPLASTVTHVYASETFNSSGFSEEASPKPPSTPIPRNIFIPQVSPEGCPLFADRQAVDSDSSCSGSESGDEESWTPGDWERRLAEKPPSITAAMARDALHKATRLREHADNYAQREAHSAAARSYDAVLSLTRFAPPSLATAADRASLRNACDIAAAKQYIIQNQPEAARRLLRKIRIRSEGLLPNLPSDFFDCSLAVDRYLFPPTVSPPFILPTSFDHPDHTQGEAPCATYIRSPFLA